MSNADRKEKKGGTLTAKEYLNQINKLDKLIENKIQELEHWRLMATSITGFSGNEMVQTSGNQQRMESAVCNYVDLQTDIAGMINTLIAKRAELIGTIEKLPAAEYDVLHKKYVQGMDFYEIAGAIDKSYSTVTTLHGSALSKVQKMLNQNGGDN